MKRTKRQETSIIIYFSFYLFLSISLLSYYVFWLIPSIKEIEEMKVVTHNTYQQLKQIEKKWLSFDEFKELSQWSKLNTYSKELISSLEKSFYDKFFINTTSANYVDYINDQNKRITQWDNYEEFLDKSLEISKILPIYTEVNMWVTDEYLSDFEFIHYIESILKTFNLEFSNEIWVSELVLVEEFSNGDEQSKLDTNIFYIPVALELEWVKWDILNFLYFIEHVGNTSIINDSIAIEHQDDDKFLYRWSTSSSHKIILEWANTLSRTQYNIFKNQFIDFAYVEFGDFIDDKRSRLSQSQDLISRIKTDQANEKYTANVELRFYVKWVQNLKIINQLNNYLTYYATTQRLFAKLKWSKTTPESVLPILDDVIQIHGELEKEQKTINQAVAKQQDLLKTLKDVSEYTELIHKLNGKIGYQFYITDVLNQIKKYQNNKELENTNASLFQYLQETQKMLSGLEKTQKETLQQYNNRLNNRNIFMKVLQIEKTINALK